MIVDILALDGVFDTGLAALQDTLATASELSADVGGPAIEPRVISLRRNTRTANGHKLSTSLCSDDRQARIIVVPAIGAKTPEGLAQALTHRDIAKAGELLRALKQDGAIVAAACTGTFVLAESGLLDGKIATTSWWLGPFFRSRYPEIVLDDRQMLVVGDGIVTAGAVLAHFDLGLWLVRQASPALAATTARYLMIDPRPSQTGYAIPDHLAHSDPLVERFEQWARDNLDQGFSLQAAEEALGTSRRTLARRLKSVLGKTPLNFVHDLRVERAVHLLRTSSDSVEAIAEKVGYADGVTLRTLLRRRLGRTASQLRNLEA
ncbi:HTH-type transcriptional regulator CdhR [Methyloligella halotolerans]|uniref:HTH-type transcriptional regulator CdhR n=1 Tax=Methyloligella halotolerans TaxID=1177755 RepID=A0A1E2RWJ5_9HYPH|nr:helix-turn-helix domain-containing protein [Methyloligella halotolerans]ODA66505.1 HTH-type transcriptional regulator CdhR [Methyloligella halotolerans]